MSVREAGVWMKVMATGAVASMLSYAAPCDRACLGKVRTVKMTNGTTFTVPPPYDTPYTFLIGELFKIKNRKIHQIEAAVLPVPYGMPSGWGK